MPHLPENNPLEILKQELRMLRHRIYYSGAPSDTELTKVAICFGQVQRLADEQLKLKRAFRQQAVKANAAKLRASYLEAQLARANTHIANLETSLQWHGAQPPPPPPWKGAQ